MDDSGFIVVALLLGGIAIMFIWLELVEKPKEIREKKNWIQKNQKKLKLQEYISLTLNGLGTQLPPCQKCGSTEFQLWEVINNDTTVRCTSCKKKFKHAIDLSIKADGGESMNFRELLYGYTTLVQFAFQEGESELGKYLRNYLKWDFSSLRKGQILIRAITFYANSEYAPPLNKYDNVKNDEPSRRITQRVMDKVWNRDRGKCVQCGSQEKLEFDHIIPFSKGGSNGYRNIQLLCESCNRSKSNNIG